MKQKMKAADGTGFQYLVHARHFQASYSEKWMAGMGSSCYMQNF